MSMPMLIAMAAWRISDAIGKPLQAVNAASQSFQTGS
jgi:hypothetical protein